jgi:hypothetical protein
MLLSVYYVDIYYDMLYANAQSRKLNKTARTITEGYEHALDLYLQSIKEKKRYLKLLSAITTLFVDNGFPNMSVPECVDYISYEFIPHDYFETSIDDRTTILCGVLTNVNILFIRKIANKYIRVIIDERGPHRDEENRQQLIDEFMDILLMERHRMYQLFMNKKTKIKNRIDINITAMEGLQSDLKAMYKECHAEKKKNFALRRDIIKKDLELGKMRGAVELLNKLVDDLKAKLEAHSSAQIVYIDTNAQNSANLGPEKVSDFNGENSVLTPSIHPDIGRINKMVAHAKQSGHEHPQDHAPARTRDARLPIIVDDDDEDDDRDNRDDRDNDDRDDRDDRDDHHDHDEEEMAKKSIDVNLDQQIDEFFSDEFMPAEPAHREPAYQLEMDYY